MIAPRIEHWIEAFELNTTEALINSVSSGLGLGCLSRLAAKTPQQDGRVVILNVPLDMKRRFWMLVHKEKYQNPLLRQFIEFCPEWQAKVPCYNLINHQIKGYDSTRIWRSRLDFSE